MTKEFIEYTIKIKDEKNSLSEKEISYEPVLISKENSYLAAKVDSLAKRFFEINESQEAPEVVLKFKMVWQS